MARKKQESNVPGLAPWMATFGDLMNLLLCFFVLLFSLSTISEEKFEKISISMANSFGVFDGGGSSVPEGQMISSGISQLNELDAYFSSMGKTVEGKTESTDITNTEQGTEGSSGSEGVMDTTEGAEGVDGSQGTDSTGKNSDVGVEKALATIQDEKAKVTSGMYDQISDLTEQYYLGDYVELNIDPNYQFVQLTVMGSILYDSGSAELKDGAKPVLFKIGEILKNFKQYNIEITGHTDNIPIYSSTYRDNNWLSSARALNAAEYLINSCGMDPNKLKYSGRGEYEPIDSNSTSEGRAKNRRIEIKIYNQYSGN